MSKGGKDSLDNMIGLCANCHRKVHYSKEKEKLKNNFLEISQKRNKKLLMDFGIGLTK